MEKDPSVTSANCINLALSVVWGEARLARTGYWITLITNGRGHAQSLIFPWSLKEFIFMSRFDFRMLLTVTNFLLVVLTQSALRVARPAFEKLNARQSVGWADIPKPTEKLGTQQVTNSISGLVAHVRRKRSISRLASARMLTKYFEILLIPEMVGVPVPPSHCLKNDNGAFCHFCQLQSIGILCGWGEARAGPNGEIHLIIRSL